MQSQPHGSLGWPQKGTPKCRPSLMEVDSGCKIEANHTSEYILSEVDWGAHDSSVFLYLEQIDHDKEPHEPSLFLYLGLIDHDGEPQDFFTSGLWGGLLQGKFPSNNYVEDCPKETSFKNEVLSIMWLLLQKALQRSFKTLCPHSKISDEIDFGKCVSTSQHVNANLDQLVTGKVVTAVLHQSIVFLNQIWMCNCTIMNHVHTTQHASVWHD